MEHRRDTMPCWYYDKKELRHSPSINQGLSQEDETKYRREGARFILQLGNKMGLRYETMATGVVYFHRFYMIHAFQEFPRHVTSCCCLFLAGKVEETPKKCKDIMKHAKALLDEATWSEFGTDPREEVMTLERIILQTIKFDFIVDHPYTYLLKYAKCLKGDKKKLQSMVQMAWTFVNDGLCTTLCLQWEPEIIAIALMYLAGKLNKFEVVDWQGRAAKQQKWWDMFVQGISMELLEDICHQVLDLYSPKSENAGLTPGIGNASSVAAVAAHSSAALKSSSRVPAESNSKSSDLTVKSQPQASTGQPPAKKPKKEEVIKTASPAKVDSPVTQSYQYPYQFANYPPNYPPPPPAAAAVVTAPTNAASPAPTRYPYAYPPTTAQHPPMPSIPQVTPSPSSFPTTQGNNSYPSTTTASSAAPPPHFSYPPPPSAAPLPYSLPVSHNRPPPPFGTNPPSFYGPPTTPGGRYQQPNSGSFATPPGNYSRSYFPPST